MVGGSSASRARAPSKGVDFEEALGDDVPMELWTRQLRGSFHRSVLAFPPKPRSGCTWTALGAGRLLLLGGRSQGRCLADVHILQLQGPKMPSKTDRSPKSEDRGEDSDSEAEAIFFASYRAACGSGKPPKAQKSPQEMVKRRGSDSETDSEEEPERSKMSNLSRAMPCSTQEVLAMASQVKKTPSPSGKSRRACQPKVAERVEEVMTSRKRAGDNRRRWKNTHRRGHVQGTARCCRCLCFAARPLRCWCTAAWETVGFLWAIPTSFVSLKQRINPWSLFGASWTPEARSTARQPLGNTKVRPGRGHVTLRCFGPEVSEAWWFLVVLAWGWRANRKLKGIAGCTL